MECRWYQVQTAIPETLLDDLGGRDLHLAEVSVEAGDDYGLYVVGFQLRGSTALLDVAERAWGLHASCRA